MVVFMSGIGAVAGSSGRMLSILCTTSDGHVGMLQRLPTKDVLANESVLPS